MFTDGDPLRIVVPAGVGEDRETVGAWLAEDPTRSRVQWRQNPSAPVVWAVDDEAYNLTALIRKIVETATGEPARTQVWGPNWYRTPDDMVLHKIADALP